MPTHLTTSTGASISAEHQYTGGGVAIDAAAYLKVGTISERTSGNGVTIDGVVAKDGLVTFPDGNALAVAEGGTGASAAAGARTNLGAATSGANTDITSLGGLTTELSIAQGGTGESTFTTNGVVYKAAAKFATTLAGTSSQLLKANASGVPVWDYDMEYIAIVCAAPGTALTASSDTAHFHFPFAGYIQTAFAGVSTPSQGTSVKVDVVIGSTSIFTTQITIDAEEVDTSTAAAPNVIDTGNNTFSQWDRCKVQVDDGGSTAATGLVVTFICVRTN